MPRLARRFTVIAVDLRGVGGSTAKPGGYDDNAAFNVFSRKDGAIRHTWGDEMGMETADPSQDPRGAPDPMPLLSILDMTPEGRGTTGIRSSTIAADRPPAEHGDGFFAVDNAQAEKNGATTW